MTSLALMYEHRTPEKKLVQVVLWSAIGRGGLDLIFQDNIHDFGLLFDGMASDTDWTGAALPAGEKLMKLSIFNT